jgi:hypothetical protein
MTGPGEYVPDVTQGITRAEDLPHPRRRQRRRNPPPRPRPRWGRRAGRRAAARRAPHDLGGARANCPADLPATSSRHRRPRRGGRLAWDITDPALPHCRSARRAQRRAARLVAGGGLPCRAAGRHLWRDDRAFAPFATTSPNVRELAAVGIGAVAPAGAAPQAVGREPGRVEGPKPGEGVGVPGRQAVAPGERCGGEGQPAAAPGPGRHRRRPGEEPPGAAHRLGRGAGAARPPAEEDPGIASRRTPPGRFTAPTSLKSRKNNYRGRDGPARAACLSSCFSFFFPCLPCVPWFHPHFTRRTMYEICPR